MFDIAMKTPFEIGALVAQVAALLLAAFAALGLVFWDGAVAKAFAGAVVAVFLATAAAPAGLGPKVGVGLISVVAVLCFMAPEGDVGIQPGRFVLLFIALPFGFALSATLFADSIAALVRKS